MRFSILPLIILAAPSASAFAAPSGSTSSVSAAQLQQLREELKAEIKAELAAEGVATGAVQEDTWAEEEWKWEEPVRPELNFLQLNGYFRFRYDFFKNLDLGTYYNNGNTQQGPFTPGLAPPVPICQTDPACNTSRYGDNNPGHPNSLGGANMRLRLEPTLNVFEDIKLKMQIDVLDNLILGSTPDGFGGGTSSIYVPLISFSQAQVPPSDGVNALVDSIRVKRIWAEVMTPLGQLRVGRMGSHFGMGLLANDGRGVDADYGDTNDRIMFVTKIAGHYIAPAYDWVSKGPTSASRLQTQGQPFDREQLDDVSQYILAVAKTDKDQEIKEKLENDESVLNYGTYQVYRTQAYDSPEYTTAGRPNEGVGATSLIKRDAWFYAYSYWLKFMYRKFLFEAEYVGILGSIGNPRTGGTLGTVPEQRASIAQHGGAFRIEYKLLHDALTLHLLVAAASGDKDFGWGVYPASNSSPTAGSWDGSQTGDHHINNFRFDPDFRVDLILWRTLVGTLTDALVVRPGVQYNLTEGFGGRLDLVYSRAWFAESTPSAGRPGGGDNNLGLEADLKLFYQSDDGFHAWLEYGLFLPFAGLNSFAQLKNADGTFTGTEISASLAQTIRAVLAVTF